MSATLGDDTAQRLARMMSGAAPQGATSAAADVSDPAASDSSASGTPPEQQSGSGGGGSGGGEAARCRLLQCDGRMFPVTTKFVGGPRALLSCPATLTASSSPPGGRL